LLALQFLHPEREHSLTEAAALTGVSIKTIHTEASRLVAAGFVSDSRRGSVAAGQRGTADPGSGPGCRRCCARQWPGRFTITQGTRLASRTIGKVIRRQASMSP
jgi:hypothetical protein